jgi:peptidoglycan/xylan/chitin deacetylase (PgdA/CDA1 family)
MSNSQADEKGRASQPDVKRWIKSVVFFGLYYSGLEWLLARMLPAKGVAVLMYHGVCDRASIPAHINFHVSRDIFERQMQALKRRYHVLPLSDVVDSLTRGEALEKAVALTFDDGYKNNASYAAPVLNRLGLPFTVFVATAFVDNGRWMPLNELYWMRSEGKLSWDEMTSLREQLRNRPAAEALKILGPERKHPETVSVAAAESFAMLSWDEVREMASNGADFGSHTHSHCNMAIEGEAQQRQELQISKELLEKHVGSPVRLFAYPYGYLSDVSRSNVVQAGYECALSTEYGLVTSRSDRFVMSRLGHDRRMWMFTGELLYQFCKQAAKDLWAGPIGRATPQNALTKQTKERHG